MYTLQKILLVVALGLPMAAQGPAADYEAVRFQANAALEKGSFHDAVKLYERALDLRREAFGENSAPYASALVDLARAYQASGERRGQAISLYRQALPIQEAMLGADHPDVATTLLYLALGAIPDAAHPDERRQLFQRALDIRTKAFGASDLRVAEILTPLARLTHDETLYQRSLAILDATAADSAAAATTLELYSRFLRDGDRGAEAEPLETRAKQIRTARVAAIGANHPALSAAPGMRVGHGVTPPKLKRKTEPEYSDIARADKAQGTVVLKLDVGTDGLAHNIQLVRGIGLGLDENAAEAISRWEFIPGTLNGQPVTVMATVEVNFKLL